MELLIPIYIILHRLYLVDIGIGTQDPEQVLHLQGDANSGNILSIRGLNDLSYLSIYTSKTLETGLLGFTNTPIQLELKNINSGGTILISNAKILETYFRLKW